MAALQEHVHQRQLMPTSSNTGGGAVTNPWLREGEAPSAGYSPEHFYVRATDWHGHGERINTKIPPEVAAQIAKMVSEEDLPDYESAPDFVRDAIVHHLHARRNQLSTGALRASLDEQVRLLTFERAMIKASDAADRWTNLVERFTKAMTTLLNDEAYAQMWVLTRETEDFTDECPDPYYTKGHAAIAEWKTKIPVEFHTA